MLHLERTQREGEFILPVKSLWGSICNGNVCLPNLVTKAEYKLNITASSNKMVKETGHPPLS